MIRLFAALWIAGLVVACGGGEVASQKRAPATDGGAFVHAASPLATNVAETPLAAPPGWHAWSKAPVGCGVFVPDDLASMAPPPVEACGGGARACRVLTAPWAAASGWGFGGLLSAVRRDGATWIALSRSPEPAWWESLVMRDGEVAAAFRVHLPRSGCSLGGPWLERGEGSGAPRAALVVVRASAQNAATVLLGRADSLADAVERTETFGPPDSALLARDVALLTPTRLVLLEHGGRFTLRPLDVARDDETESAAPAKTVRPRPDDASFVYLQQVTAAGSTVLYAAWNGVRGEVWRVRDGASERVLGEAGVSFDALAGDGAHVAWTRARGRRGINRFDDIELWTAAVDGVGALHGAHRVTRLPGGELPLVSVGDGWIAARVAADDVRLYRLADGRERRLPALPGVGWDGGAFGLVVAGDEVFAKGYRVGAGASGGNDVRFVARVDLRNL